MAAVDIQMQEGGFAAADNCRAKDKLQLIIEGKRI
jgi:hypothetical protein